MIQLNYRDSRPIYEQIRDGLKRLIITGAVGTDERLPSVRELASQLAINPNTIAKAFKELEQEGLFDQAHKKPLPEYPKTIGVVTSDKGAALQDIINILSRRYPVGELRVYPSLVQGEDAPASLCRSLSIADCDDCDVIIIGRGGGASEDLAAFNDRQLAYYIYHLNIHV